ncbi:TPM domain-containing protein [Ideonella sp. BN130291]|uniref:TPM domain-containing protein n=1 Tax=Ideonella sp. BN130291 TaxID=3112940 RepID=UPI002E2665C9|nr:TPM domain-containing protein [Ideonella sp. BN130291]
MNGSPAPAAPALPGQGAWARLKRLLRHRWMDESDARRLVDDAALDRLQQRVQASERRHTGEIRLCIEAGLPVSYAWAGASARQRAVAMFGKLRVWDTEHNNGVLIYLLLAEHAIEVVADRGLACRVPPDEWDRLVAGMASAFREGHFEAGLMQAIEAVEALLVQHFPIKDAAARSNELPDRPYRG